MVKYNHIIMAMEDYIEKCSNKELKNRLDKMTNKEKDEKLKTILSTAEFYHYKRLFERLEQANRHLKDYENQLEKYGDSEFYQRTFTKSINELKKEISETEDDIFHYEVKIFRKHEPKEYSYSQKDYHEGIEYEESEIKHQNENEYTEYERGALESYFMGGYGSLNEGLWNDKELDERDKRKSKSLSESINKNELSHDTIIYNGGHYPTGKVGDPITFKGFTSATYDFPTAVNFSKGCIYKFLAPKGTHCFNANMDGIARYGGEHEVLLDKNLKGTIVGFEEDFKGVPIVVVQL